MQLRIFGTPSVALSREFASCESTAAWYACAAHETDEIMVVECIFAAENIVYEVDGISETLPAGSPLLRCRNGDTHSIPIAQFEAAFSRCFRDGSIISPLTQNPVQQAIALNRCNTQLRAQLAACADRTDSGVE